eukprot:2652937-Amphidinium_carterae.1
MDSSTDVPMSISIRFSLFSSEVNLSANRTSTRLSQLSLSLQKIVEPPKSAGSKFDMHSHSLQRVNTAE